MASVTNSNAAVVAKNGLGPRTLIVKCAKSSISQAEIDACALALQTGGTYSGVTNDAFTIAGVIVNTNDVVFALQGTGTVNADASDALGVTGVTLTVEHTFA